MVIGRDHLDSGSVASPYRETEAMQDGSDAIGDWPILNALLNTASGAAWVAVHHGGGVGIGRSLHAGAQVVADGTEEAARRLERVLRNDPGTGVMRHADAGYEIAIETARERGLDLPMLSLSACSSAPTWCSSPTGRCATTSPSSCAAAASPPCTTRPACCTTSTPCTCPAGC